MIGVAEIGNDQKDVLTMEKDHLYPSLNLHSIFFTRVFFVCSKYALSPFGQTRYMQFTFAGSHFT